MPDVTAGSTERVPFFDLSHQFDGLEEAVSKAWEEILRSRQFVAGTWIERFEDQFSEAHSAAHCIAVSNGTVALELILRALGLQPGDEVVVPTNSFIATAEAVSNTGGVPVFVDVEAETSNIDPQAVQSAIGSRTFGVIGVHLYGTPFDVASIGDLAGRNGLAFVEDAAQAHLATAHGRRVGTFGHAAGFSFYPGKNLGAPGDGGAILTDDDGLAGRLRILRDHGQTERYRSEIVGTNARMSELVASTLAIKLPKLPGWTESRQHVADTYEGRLAGEVALRFQSTPEWATSARHLFPVEAAGRDNIRNRLATAGIATGLHYPIPIHLQRAYRHLGYRTGDFPVAEAKAASQISLPMFPGLTESQVDWVAAALLDAVARES